MDSLLAHPAVQGGVAPFVVALVVTAVLLRLRFAGIALAAGFFAAVWLIDGFSFSPLTATRKLVLVALVAAVVGLVADGAFKPTRSTGIVLALAAAAATVWVFWSVLSQKEMPRALVLGAGIATFSAVVVSVFGALKDDGVRAGAAALGLGLGVGVCAILAASAKFGQFGIAVGASAGGFLLVQMLAGRSVPAGFAGTLPTSVTAALIGAGTLMLAELPWFGLPLLALCPLAALVPVARGRPVFLQAIAASIAPIAAAAIACTVVWFAGR